MTKVGWNYGTKTLCPICSEEDDTQEHLLLCNQLAINNSSPSNHLPTRVETALRRREKILAAIEASDTAS